jgi:hypothetical protein
MHESPETETTFGYLSAVESPEHGFFGGYLVISPWGRPLEFHCTAPVLPNRAQRILYGATLESYLLAERIGDALLSAAKLSPRLILTDRGEFAPLRQKVAVPLALVRSAVELPGTGPIPAAPPSETPASSAGSAAAIGEHPSWHGRLHIRDWFVQLPVGFEWEQSVVVELVELLVTRVDAVEPFDRIHEAIREAQRISTRSQDSHGQAA